MTRTLRQKVDRVGEHQRAAVRRAILELRREGIELTRDRLRQRAQVDNNAATVLLAAYRAGAFEVLDDQPAAMPTAARAATPPPCVITLGPRALQELEAGRWPMPVDLDGRDPEGIDVSVLSHMGMLLNPRRKRAVLRFLQLMIEAELRDLPGLDGEGDLDEQAAAIGLDPERGYDLAAPEDEDQGLRALERLGLDTLEPWNAACRGEARAPAEGAPRATKRRAK